VRRTEISSFFLLVTTAPPVAPPLPLPLPRAIPLPPLPLPDDALLPPDLPGRSWVKEVSSLVTKVESPT